MLDPALLKTFRPLFVMPCFGEKLCMNAVLTIIPLQREAIAPGMACDFHFLPGDSLMTRVRNDCVAFFLSQPAHSIAACCRGTNRDRRRAATCRSAGCAAVQTMQAHTRCGGHLMP